MWPAGILLWVISVAVLPSCSRFRQAPDLENLILLPEEVAADCHLRVGPKPMVMRPATDAGRKNAEVILGFWFGTGQVPVDNIDLAISNILTTDSDALALTMITMRFRDRDVAESARAQLPPSATNRLIEVQGRYLMIFASSGSISSECSQRAAEHLIAKLSEAEGNAK